MYTLLDTVNVGKKKKHKIKDKTLLYDSFPTLCGNKELVLSYNLNINKRIYNTVKIERFISVGIVCWS